MVTTVLFDFDGTLVNSLGAILHSWREALHEQGVDLSDIEVVREVFYTTQEERTKLLPINAAKAEHDHQATLAPARSSYELQEGLVAVLEELSKRGINMGIVSSTHSEPIKATLERLGVLHYFSVVLGRDSGLPGKPNPDMVTRALELLGATAGEALFVGDSQIDILAGERAGVKTALYTPATNDPYRDNELLKTLHPTYHFTQYADFITTIGA
jgi:HAD superfamily hydrolase (TIGR01549 family)